LVRIEEGGNILEQRLGIDDATGFVVRDDARFLERLSDVVTGVSTHTAAGGCRLDARKGAVWPSL